MPPPRPAGLRAAVPSTVPGRLAQTVAGRARDLAGQAQHAVGAALRERVAGPDAAERGPAIWGTPGERWFTPDDPIWRVQEDASMYAGGVAALLLQMLHPLAMAGVAGHSGYRSDPWGRLQRTADYLAITTFGTAQAGEATIARVRDIHSRVRGKDHRGRPYRADDPDLLRWVHVAECYSFLAAHRAYGRDQLSPEDADRYVVQSGSVSQRLGTHGLPQSVAELTAQLDAFRPDLEVTPAAIEAARFLLVEPPLAVPLRPGYWFIAAGGVAVLPPWARRMLRLPDRAPLPRLAAGAGQLATRTVRWGIAGLREDRTAGHRAVNS
ncbi:MAG: DUF2236 domain-containing protein [Austwickia sp.]|nr:DUF2236 domain-containing protein [Austwickia sp.]MCO5308438.1 DUF2236 domain-containing protein [Austwickia sp.]